MRLDVELVNRGLIESRNKAGIAIKSGSVRVNGEIVIKASTQILESDIIEIDGEVDVSRAAQKLRGALKFFRDDGEIIQIQNKDCLDIGASTGGFVSVLLEEGAKKVVALDVGHGQLARSLRDNPKVENAEGVHILNYDEAESFHIVTCDVSFISLKKVLPKIKELLKKDGVAIVLIKPQFEVGKEVLRKFKKGVITDEKLLNGCVENILIFAKDLGFKQLDVTKSSQKGLTGNQEFIALLA